MEPASQELRPVYYDHLDWLPRPDFWALHVHSFCCLGYGCELTRAEIMDAFVVPEMEVWEYYRHEFRNTDADPEYSCHRLMLPFPAGGGIAFEYHESPEDNHMQYRVYAPDPGGSTQVGGYNGQSWDAEFSWAELQRMRQLVEQATDDKILRASAIPLLFPGLLLESGDNVEEIRKELRASWRELGALKPERTESVVDAMIDESQGVSGYIHSQPYRAIQRESGLVLITRRSSDTKPK